MLRRVAVLISGSGTNLGAILEEKAKGNIPSGEIALVIASARKGADPASVDEGVNRAIRAGVKTLTVHPDDYETTDTFEAELIKALKEENIDLVVLAGYLCILSDSFVGQFPDRIINVHPSLIPSFCGEGYYGLRVHEAALKRGVKVTGATVHIVNHIVDGGPILMQQAVEVKEGDTPKSLQQRVLQEAEWVILPKAVEYMCRNLEGGSL